MIVEHVLRRCALAEDKSEEVRRSMAANLSVQKLLYRTEGISRSTSHFGAICKRAAGSKRTGRRIGSKKQTAGMEMGRGGGVTI